MAGAHNRRGIFPDRGSNRPVPRTLCHVNRKLGLHVQKHVGFDKCLVERYAGARKTLPQDRCPADRSVRLPSNKLPEQTWRGKQGQSVRSGKSRTFAARHRRNGKARACFECQTRHVKVHASFDVLIGERGRTRANTHAGTICSDVVSQNGLKPWPDIDQTIGLEFAMM